MPKLAGYCAYLALVNAGVTPLQMVSHEPGLHGAETTPQGLPPHICGGGTRVATGRPVRIKVFVWRSRSIYFKFSIVMVILA